MFEKKKICVKFGFVYAREPRSGLSYIPLARCSAWSLGGARRKCQPIRDAYSLAPEPPCAFLAEIAICVIYFLS